MTRLFDGAEDLTVTIRGGEVYAVPEDLVELVELNMWGGPDPDVAAEWLLEDLKVVTGQSHPVYSLERSNAVVNWGASSITAAVVIAFASGIGGAAAMKALDLAQRMVDRVGLTNRPRVVGPADVEHLRLRAIENLRMRFAVSLDEEVSITEEEVDTDSVRLVLDVPRIHQRFEVKFLYYGERPAQLAYYRRLTTPPGLT